MAREPCWQCSATGQVEDGHEKCSYCGGSARNPADTTQGCPRCGATGASGNKKYRACPVCHGSQYLAGGGGGGGAGGGANNRTKTSPGRGPSPPPPPAPSSGFPVGKALAFGIVAVPLYIYASPRIDAEPWVPVLIAAIAGLVAAIFYKAVLTIAGIGVAGAVLLAMRDEGAAPQAAGGQGDAGEGDAAPWSPGRLDETGSYVAGLQVGQWLPTRTFEVVDEDGAEGSDPSRLVLWDVALSDDRPEPALPRLLSPGRMYFGVTDGGARLVLLHREDLDYDAVAAIEAVEPAGTLLVTLASGETFDMGDRLEAEMRPALAASGAIRLLHSPESEILDSRTIPVAGL